MADRKDKLVRVNIADLVSQYRGIQTEIEEAVLRVLRSGSYVLGENVRALEAEMVRYCGVRYALGVNSGTDALLLALMALDVGPGDEVIVPAFTIIVDAAVVCLLRAKPVFVDIDPSTFNIDVNQLEQRITERTKAIVAVHLYGQMAEMDKIMTIARAHDIAVVEDACQAIGAEHRSRRAGSVGQIGCFSFYPTKNLGAYGDGGLITTDDEGLWQKIRLLRGHGDVGQYDHVTIGLNSRLDEIQAAVLRAKLTRVDIWNDARRRNAQRYTASLEAVDGIEVPRQTPDSHHVYHQYTIRAKNRDSLQQHLKEHDITTAIYYPVPLHLQKALNHLTYKTGNFPESERASREVLSLPVYAELEADKIDYVVDRVRSFFSAKA
jgi:dTDP-4-amino-4,6-dideoxygalactose transaminase